MDQMEYLLIVFRGKFELCVYEDIVASLVKQHLSRINVKLV